MKILVLLGLLALLLSTAHSNTVEFEQKDVLQNWQWLSGQLSQISELALTDNQLSEDCLIKVLSHQMPKLDKLGFTPYNEQKEFYRNMSTVLTPKVVQTIFKSKYFSHLLELDLSETNANDNWFEFLANQTLNSTLKILKLNKLRLGKKGFGWLSKINFNGLLIHLQVSNTLLIEDAAVQSLLKMICKFDEEKLCKNRFQVLVLQNTEITRDGFIKLIKSINSTTLKILTLSSAFLHYNKTYKEGFNYTAYQIMSKISYPKLEELIIYECGLNDEIAKLLSSWKLPQLKKLLLIFNPITDQGFKAMVHKQNMPSLTNISIHGTQIKDQGFKHLKQQSFALKSLNFGRTKVSDAGFNYLKKTNLSSLVRLYISDILVRPNIFYSFMKEVNCQNLVELSISEMNGLTDFLKEFPWKKFEKLQMLQILVVQIADGYRQLISKNSTLLPNLKKLHLTGTKISFIDFNNLTYILPTLFPQLSFLQFKQEQTPYPVSLRKIYTVAFKQGTLFDFFYVKLKKGKKLEIVQLIIYQYLHFDNTFDGSISSYTQYQDYFNLLNDRVDFSNIKITQLVSPRQIGYFKILFQTLKITSFPTLKRIAISTQPDMNAEVFFTFFNEKQFPSLAYGMFKLTVPGDVEENFIQSKIMPFFNSFKKINTLFLSLTFLNEDNGAQKRKQLLDQLHYPFLISLEIPQQQMTVPDLTQLIKKHAMTLNSMNLAGNFLQEKLFQLFYDNRVILQDLNLQKISFTAEEFRNFGKVSTEFIQDLILAENDLTDQHLKAMIENKRPGPYFPKLRKLNISDNSIQRQGLDSWLDTQMFNLFYMDNQRNYNPSFLNSLLRYPTKVKNILAESFDIYSLEKDIVPESVRNVVFLGLKTYGFTIEDFSVLASLDFKRLQKSFLYLNNIYQCEVLKNLLAINRQTAEVINNFKNDKIGLNSKCLQNHSHQSHVIKIQILDQYGTIYIPEYIEMLTNSTRDIQILNLVRTRLSPASLKKILKRKLHSAIMINLEHNYLDDQTFRILLSNELQHLKYLSVKATQITSDSVVALASKKLPSLIALDLSQNDLGVAAIQTFKIIGANLSAINLDGCNLQGDSLKILKDTVFPRLKQLRLSYNQFSEQDVYQFLTDIDKKNVPELGIISLKGVSLSIPKHQTLQKIMKNKGFQRYEIDRPYNIPQSNAAKI